MSFTKRTNLGSLLSTKWYQYAVRRTGVEMPNCFTYACARISEIIVREQPLDVNRVRGAGDLWESHAPEFSNYSNAKQGALMIWKGGNGSYGHVAIVEEVIDANTIEWSESNYGMNMFDVVKRNPIGYAGLIFMGYLHHKDLNSSSPMPNPKTNYKIGSSVCTNTLASSSSGENVYHGNWNETITKIIQDAPYPYLLNNGTGWTNNQGIDKNSHTPEKPKKTNEIVYIVQANDTLNSIACKFNTTYQKIAEYNAIENPNIIYVGQKIKIPK